MPLDPVESRCGGAPPMNEAAKQFRRVNGFMHLKNLRASLERHVAAHNTASTCYDKTVARPWSRHGPRRSGILQAGVLPGSRRHVHVADVLADGDHDARRGRPGQVRLPALLTGSIRG
jgi:hypothetical protein